MCGNDFAVIGAVAELMATVITMIILCYSVTNNTVRNILCTVFYILCIFLEYDVFVSLLTIV